MAATKIRAAIYTRISLDRYADDPARAGAGVTRQREDCEKLCADRGWQPATVYTDNDVSAYSGRRRPGYEAMYADIAAGRINAVIVWHLDRLHRRPIELEQFMELCDQHRVKLATVTGDIDLGTDSGRLHARIMGAVARAESERKSVRTVRANQQRAEQGHGMLNRSYGYDAGRIVPAEARRIREAARRILAGESLAAVTRDLNNRGARTIAGNEFLPSTLKAVLVSARISGRREYIPTAEYLGKGRTRPAIGPIVATTSELKRIIEVGDSNKLRALLTNPARRTNNRSGATMGRPPSTLLSGFLRCTRCKGHPMVSRPKRGQPCYQCVKAPGRGGCDGTAIVGWRTDEQITDEVVDRLAAVGLTALLADDADDPQLLDRLSTADERRAEIIASFADGEISRVEMTTGLKRLDDRYADDRAQLARTDATRALEPLTGCITAADFAARWDTLTVAQQRAILDHVLLGVDVYPGGRGGHWNPDRLKPRWRD